MQKIAGNKGATTRSDSTGQAAPTMSQFQSAESFGKNIAQASFTATAVPDAPKKTDDFLATISEDISGLAQMDLKQIIVSAILQAGKDAVKETAKGAAQTAYDYNPLKRPGEAIGNFIGGMLFG
jgi:molecular chaperone DnaK (HSP70)